MRENMFTMRRDAPVYAKHGRYPVRKAVPGEEVVTILDGKEETRNTAQEGDMVVTGAKGEDQVVSAETFAARYTPTGVEGEYRAVGCVRAVQNTTQEDVAIEAPWGGVQTQGPDCFFALPCTEDGVPLPGEAPYLIDRDAFERTYTLTNKT